MSSPILVDQRPVGTPRVLYWLQSVLCWWTLIGVGALVQCASLLFAFGIGRPIDLLLGGYIAFAGAVSLAGVVVVVTNPVTQTPARVAQRLHTFIKHIGLAAVTRRTLLWAGLAVPASLAAAVVGVWVTTALGLTSAPVDDRAAMLAGASPVQVVSFGLLAAPLVEEGIFRAPLLLIVAHWSKHRHPRVRTVVMVVAVVASSAWFGWIHHEYGLVNVVSAAISGLVYAGLALVSRSLVPSMVAHAAHNILAGAAMASIA